MFLAATIRQQAARPTIATTGAARRSASATIPVSRAPRRERGHAIRGESSGWSVRSTRLCFGHAAPVVASRRNMATRSEARNQIGTAFLRLVKVLIQRLLGVGQASQRCCPGGQRIGAIAQTLDRIGTLPGG